MQDSNNSIITVKTNISSSLENIWRYWTVPEHIKKWNNASDTWHTPSAENDLKIGGKFLYRMEAKDGSFGFDFWGIYDEVNQYNLISYTLGDGRKVSVSFTSNNSMTKIVETFEAENENSLELQQKGWQAILDNFKKYVEKQ